MKDLLKNTLQHSRESLATRIQKLKHSMDGNYNMKMRGIAKNYRSGNCMNAPYDCRTLYNSLRLEIGLACNKHFAGMKVNIQSSNKVNQTCEHYRGSDRD